jgi:pyruvate-formate lyase
MTQRLRIHGKRIGQIDSEVLDLYMQVEPYDKNKLYMLAEILIGREILNRPLDVVEDDLEEANALVKNMHYRTICEFLEDYMRERIKSLYKICGNCENHDSCGICHAGLQNLRTNKMHTCEHFRYNEKTRTDFSL